MVLQPTFVPLFRRCMTYTKYAAGTIFVASMTSAWYYRPIPDDTTTTSTTKSTSDCDNESPINPNHNHTNQHINNINNINHNSNRSKEFFCAPYASPPWNREHVPILLEWARRISIGVTTLAIRLVMNTYGQYTIIEDSHYHDFLNAVFGGENGQQQQRSPKQGLITVSNHRSLLDDPGIVSCLLPLNIAIQPKYNRWGICSQEYCFNDALPGLIKGYIGAGQVLPICRGGGINQRLLLDFARHLANGEWCHVFPEGGVWQWEELGGRRQLPPNAVAVSSSDFGKITNPTSNAETNTNTSTPLERQQIIYATTQQKVLPPSPIGKLKWGVGKLIAHAPVTPKVIPFAHRGMEKLLPQDEITGKTKLRDNLLRSFLPSLLLGGNTDDESHDDKLRVIVRFGQEIRFDDLLQEHEKQHGKLWKYSGTLNAEEEYHQKRTSTRSQSPSPQQQQHSVSDDEQTQIELWNSSSEAERVLYSKIVRRIEYHLDDITRKVCKEE